jgi:hypothetical protein
VPTDTPVPMDTATEGAPTPTETVAETEEVSP